MGFKFKEKKIMKEVCYYGINLLSNIGNNISNGIFISVNDLLSNII